MANFYSMTTKPEIAPESSHPACRCDQLEQEVSHLRTDVRQLEE